MMSAPLPNNVRTATATTNNASAAVKSTNIQWHDQAVKRDERWKVNGHNGAVVWFTGLSGSGKSSIANHVEMMLNRQSISTYLLDGDNIRHGLCKDLGFSIEDRSENIRRVGQVAKLMADAGMVVLTALISPYREDRDLVRSTIEEIKIQFIEVHVNASLEICERRDPKGLYKLARQGKITNFTGIDDPYEEPLSAELVLYSNEQNSIDQLAKQTISFLEEKKII